MCWRQLTGNDIHKKAFYSSSLCKRQRSADTKRYAGLHPFQISWCLLFEFWDERYLGIVQRKQSLKKKTTYLMVAQDTTKIKAHSKGHYITLTLLTKATKHGMLKTMGSSNWRRQRLHTMCTLASIVKHRPENHNSNIPTNYYFYFYINFMVFLLDN